MSKKKIIIFVIIAVIVLSLVIILGLTVITPTLFLSENNSETSSEDTPQIADSVPDGLELIGPEETPRETVSEATPLVSEEIASAENSVDEMWQEHMIEIGVLVYDEEGNLVYADEGEYQAHEEEDIGQIELEEPYELTSSLVRFDNPAYLNMETNLGTNGFYNLYECIQDYIDYYFVEPKEYEGTIIEGSYEDKGDYRTFYVEVYHDNGTWLIECNYVVSMNYYEFFCDDINPRERPTIPQ